MDAAMTGNGEIADAVLSVLAGREGRPYWRSQATVGQCNFAMDDSSAENTACLATLAEDLVDERDEELAIIGRSLTAG